jgi:hypothetical protein
MAYDIGGLEARGSLPQFSILVLPSSPYNKINLTNTKKTGEVSPVLA